LIGIEACSSAHHWGRELTRLGHTVRLIPAQYVKPYVKRNKTDAADAEAICEAVGRPHMRFVPIKTVEQQSILALHRSRSLLVRQRTSAINAARGLLSEFGVIAARGIRRIAELRQRMSRMAPALLPDEAREAIDALFEHLDGLEQRIDKVEARILYGYRDRRRSGRW
jgi:transposase